MNNRKFFAQIVDQFKSNPRGPASLTELWESNRGPKSSPGVRSVSRGQTIKWKLYREIKEEQPTLSYGQILRLVSARFHEEG